MPAYAAIATENGDYVFFGGEPSVPASTIKRARSRKRNSIMSSVQEFVSLCGERAVRFFEKEHYDGKSRYDSHGKHGRKRLKARHLPR